MTEPKEDTAPEFSKDRLNALLTKKAEENPEEVASAMDARDNAAADARATAEAGEPPKYFQHYHSSKPSMKMLTKTGMPVIFVGGKLITDNPEVIEYLNTAIDAGLKMVKKGKLLTAEEADPMAAFKKKVIADHEAAKAKEAEERAAQSVNTTGPLGSNAVPTSLNS